MRTLFCTLCLALLLTGCKKATSEKTKEADKGPTAAALSEEFKKDQQAADKKYKDKTLSLSATVVHVLSKDDTGKDYVILLLEGMQKPNKEDDGPNIECAIVKDSEGKALALIQTQHVKVTGKYKKVGKDESQPDGPVCIFLEDCKIEEVGPDPSIPVTAAELAKAFATDADGAKKKYMNKMVIVEGKFVTSERLQFLGEACIFEGYNKDGKPFNVVALADAEKLGNPETGATVKFRAMCDGQGAVDGTPCVRLLGARPVK